MLLGVQSLKGRRQFLDHAERDFDPIEMALYLIRPIPSFFAMLRDEPDKTLPMVRVAIAYARFGLPVVPCYPRTKRPMTTRGYLGATTDAEQISCRWDDAYRTLAIFPTRRQSPSRDAYNAAHVAQRG